MRFCRVSPEAEKSGRGSAPRYCDDGPIGAMLDAGHLIEFPIG
jgi:hypothetical protein